MTGFPLYGLTLRRELRESERIVDVLKIDASLNTAKEKLHQAIDFEQRRQTRRALRAGRPVRLEVTPAILLPLERLFELGRSEALAELGRLDVTARRAFAADPKHEQLSKIVRFLELALGKLSLKIEQQRLSLEVDGIAGDALVRALYRILGARSIAAEVVSSAFTLGLAQTFEANEDLVDGWERSAILDQNTCDPCEAGDGNQYASWADAQDEMPDGGPAVDCEGGGRCRCRLVPVTA